jgi:hypothetical protein
VRAYARTFAGKGILPKKTAWWPFSFVDGVGVFCKSQSPQIAGARDLQQKQHQKITKNVLFCFGDHPPLQRRVVPATFKEIYFQTVIAIY